MQDTFMSAALLVANTIKEHPLRVGLCERELTRLDHLVVGEIGWFNSITFRLENTSIDLYIRIDVCTSGECYETLLETDPQTGDVYKRVKFSFSVNYCAHGSASPDVVLNRAKAIAGVAGLAQDLQVLVPGEFLWFHKSKAEMDEINAQKQASEDRRRLEAFASSHSIRQIIGKTRGITAHGHKLPRGTHQVTLSNGRRFKVEVDTEFTVNLTRLD